MGLTDLFSKLIIEHGSAEVQAKHIALFKDQLALADKKINELETENSTLKNQLDNAETRIQKLTEVNEELRSEIQGNEQASHGGSLEDIKAKILVFMSKFEEIYVQNVASALGIGTQTAQFHLEELMDANMVSMSCYFGGESSWYLVQNGRKYLVRNGLIN